MKLFTPSDIIGIGRWLAGLAAQTGQWNPPPVTNFAPRKMSISLPTQQGTSSACILQDPSSHAEYQDSLQSMLQRTLLNSTPAYVSYDIEQVYSYDQVVATIGASGGGWGGSFAGHYSWADTSIHSRFLIKFVQKYYTTDLDIPNLPSDWFTHLPDYSELEKYYPCYISSIVYGRMVYILIESQSDAASTQAALNATYSGWGFNFSFNYSQADYSNVKISSIQSFVTGGSSDFLSSGNMGNVENIIASGAECSINSPGVPIAFTLRQFKDNSIVNFVTMAEYNVSECSIIGEPATVKINHAIGHLLNPAKYAGDDEFGGCVNIFGNVKLEIRGNELWAIVDGEFDECSNGDTKSKIDGSLEKNQILLYIAPPGKTIASVGVNTITYFNQTDPENSSYDAFNLDIISGFVDHISVVADTDGDDLPSDGSDGRCKFTIYFKDFPITLQ